MSKPTSLKSLVQMMDAYLAPSGETSQKERTRARILREATLLFQQQGYRKASVDEVARRAGVAKGTVYVHFKNKAELLFHALVEEKKQFAGPFRELLLAKLEPEERLRKYIEMLLLSVPKSPLSVKLMAGDFEMFAFLDELPEQLRSQVMAQADTGFHALLEGVGQLDRLSSKERELRARAFTGLIYASGALVEQRIRGGLSLEDYARQLAKIFVDGVGAK